MATQIPGQPSRTSILVAAARAVGSRDPDPTVRNPDWLSEPLIGPAERELIASHPVSRALDQDYREVSQDYHVMGLAMLMIVRTRFIDERLEHAVRNGATQVVILGAGFDTRAYRFRELLKNAKVFEVDSVATQEYKKRRIETVVGTPPPNLTYVAIDFNKDQLGDVLMRAGYRTSEKTFFIWEGVSMYIAEEGVRETLGAVARHSAPGSSLVMDYTVQGAIEMMTRFRDTPALQSLSAWGELWVFGVPDGKEQEFFAELGLEASPPMGFFSPASMSRYLKRQDGSMVGSFPGMARWSAPAGQASLGAAASAVNTSWYSIVELIVPAR